MQAVKDFAIKHLDVRNKNGAEWQCLCPYHSDSNPSFSINTNVGVFLCFACGAKGNMDDLASHLGVSGLKVIKDDKTEIERLQSLLHDFKDSEVITPTYYPESYLSRFDHELEYWNERGLSKEVQDLFNLGYDPIRDHAVIPLRDTVGRIVGIIRRQLEANAMPRYLYPRKFKISEHLFGAHLAKDYNKIAIVEGSLDCIACWDAGIPAIALLGSRLSSSQQDILAKLNPDFIVAMTDRDEAGRKEAIALKEKFGVRCSVPDYDSSWLGKDPADLSLEQRLKMFDSKGGL
jgi:DNA primase